ncbi:dissimilatory sulfite reductase (desulfoviridin) alpha/beta subunit [Rhodoligotrophos appendicifer]|uniref:hypothetical protein n=1 Tax=Rhodoligotrophos appendicifer TaxID=987056 RepID=UPI0019607133|nr:hypothetical protein [Rhodoligotrophos appendicifer]
MKPVDDPAAAISKPAAYISEYPKPMAHVRCARCDRTGKYRLATLIERYGPETFCPEVLSRIARESDCPNVENFDWSKRCALHFTNLLD